MSDIIYTYTDEAPAMATYSLFPFIKSYLKVAGIDITTADISLSGRILSNFSDYLTADQKATDWLDKLGKLTDEESANIIKLPNISASIPQLNAAIAELNEKGFKVPPYNPDPKTKEEEEIKSRYSKILGSAVNPVLREGNSDRRCAGAVKEYAKVFPHKNGAWNSSIKTDVVFMSEGDFFHNEKSKIFDNETLVSVEFVDKNGDKTTLKKDLKIEKNEVLDATFMSAKSLCKFIKESIKRAKDENLLYSAHLKATMMKISDPVIFGYFVKEFFDVLFVKFENELKGVGVNENNGLKDLFEKIENLPCKDKIIALYNEILASRPDLAMVDSDKGVTNLHVPSDVIIDASMPAMIRNSGCMWDKNGKLKETLAVIPDTTYAVVYKKFIDNLKEKGELNPAKIGSVSNVGLMAKKAEEYGSHDKTFIMKNDGKVVVKDSNGAEIFSFDVQNGDIFRMTQTKDAPIKNWIKLAVTRAKATGSKTIFWLDENRAHDANLIKIVQNELKAYDLKGLDISIKSPAEAVVISSDTIREAKDCISVTGNVLRDYLTDLYPIMELGTSAKMLSIVPLLNGGGLFETGAGGSAPKIAQQLTEENHLRWDSLGEFLALGVSLEHFGNINKNKNALIISKAIDLALSRWLKEDKSPKKKAGEPDVRSSHFYFVLFLAQELAKSELKDKFSKISAELSKNEEIITKELLAVQGRAADLGGYYKFDDAKADMVMRPSQTLNKILNECL